VTAWRGSHGGGGRRGRAAYLACTREDMAAPFLLRRRGAGMALAISGVRVAEKASVKIYFTILYLQQPGGGQRRQEKKKKRANMVVAV